MSEEIDFVEQLANRLAAASEVLGQLAQRDGRVNEILRLREALEKIAEIAIEALRWK